MECLQTASADLCGKGRFPATGETIYPQAHLTNISNPDLHVNLLM